MKIHDYAALAHVGAKRAIHPAIKAVVLAQHAAEGSYF